MRDHIAIIITCLLSILAGCERLDTPPDPTELNATDVAWATGWHIWKIQCLSLDVNGMEVVVLDEGGKPILGDGRTLTVNHLQGNPAVLRVAIKINGKSIHGRMSASGISTDFEYAEAFQERHSQILHSPILDEDNYVLISESSGKSSSGPIVRSIALRLVSILPEASQRDREPHC